MSKRREVQESKFGDELQPPDNDSIDRQDTKMNPKVRGSNLTSGAGILMVGQLYGKLMTFAMNQLLVSYVTSNSMGLTSLIEFTIGSILFFSREGIRLSVLQLNQNQNKNNVSSSTRQGLNGKDNNHRGSTYSTFQDVINLSWVSILVGIPTMVVLLYLQFFWNTQINLVSLDYSFLSIVAVVLSVLLELLSEPFYNLNQFELNLPKRTKIESISSFGKCLVQSLVVLIFRKNLSDGKLVLSFCLGQLFYSFSLLLCYYIAYTHSNPIIPQRIQKAIGGDDNEYYFDTESLRYWRSIFTQLVFKHFLTEGDKLLINFLFTMGTQGYFAVINNYGSLLARLLFLPIEESTRMFVTKIYSSNDQNSNTKVFNSLKPILKFYFYLSLIIVLFAPINTRFIFGILLKNLVASSTKNSIEEFFQAFKAYWLYLPFLSINGISEAIFYSITKDPREINNYSKLMILCSLIFTISCYTLVTKFGLGLVALIISNSINMSIRISYCLWNLNGEFQLTSKFDKKYLYFLFVSLLVYLLQLFIIGEDSRSLFDFIKSATVGLLYMILIVSSELNEVVTILNKFKIGRALLQKLKLKST